MELLQFERRVYRHATGIEATFLAVEVNERFPYLCCTAIICIEYGSGRLAPILNLRSGDLSLEKYALVAAGVDLAIKWIREEIQKNRKDYVPMDAFEGPDVDTVWGRSAARVELMETTHTKPGLPPAGWTFFGERCRCICHTTGTKHCIPCCSQTKPEARS